MCEMCKYRVSFCMESIITPITKIMLFLESLKKELSKYVYFYYRVYTSHVVPF